MRAIGDYSAGDWADRAVDYGMNMSIYRAHFDPHAVHYSGPLEMRPVGIHCLCPACASEGWYAVSPMCRFWGDSCHVCSGTRTYFDHADRKRKSCDVCPDEWRRDVAFFRDALRSPRRMAQRLRDEAARNAEEQRRIDEEARQRVAEFSARWAAAH